MTCLKYPGSKKQCADWIISHFPDDYKRMTYLEPFFGSGVVFFTKERSVIETINDRDKIIYTLFTQIRDNEEKLIYLIEHTPWSRDEYNLSFMDTEDELESVRRFLVRMWFSIGARSCQKSGFRTNIIKNGGNFSAFHQNLPDVIRRTSERLKHLPGRLVQIENLDALRLIEKYNRSNVLQYLDPPYVLSTRKNRKIYRHEFTDTDHEKLLQLARQSKAYIALSGYECDMYNDFLSGWKKDSIPVRDEMGNTRKECLWMNYSERQYYLFPF
jgi:DNA adenine methylase